MNVLGCYAKLAAEQEPPHRQDRIDPVDPQVMLIRVAGMDREA
jgi:hypothetical protein